MKSKLGVLLISSAISSVGFSGSNNVCTNYPGVYICENGKIENIDGIYGSVILDNIEVSGVMKGNIGTIDIKKSKINQIKGNIGSFIADHSVFLGKIKGNIGTIQLKKSTLNEIDAHTSDVRFYNSTAEKITLSSAEKKIKINLNNKSMVNGDIYFAENFGVVCIDKSSELKGHVINGKVVRESC